GQRAVRRGAGFRRPAPARPALDLRLDVAHGLDHTPVLGAVNTYVYGNLMRKPRRSRASSSTTRLDRHAWIDAAYGVLVREGVEQVLVLPLARRLGVTRGSFYWHFKSRGELLEALVELWQRKNTSAVVDAVRRPAKDLPERFLHIARCWFDQSI